MDMIPLIDVSLVLLIFFMLTASDAGIAAFVPTPPAEYGALSPNSQEVQLNINLEGEGDERKPVYSLSVGNKVLDEKDNNLPTMEQLLGRLKEYLDRTPERVEVTINAHPDVKSGRTRESRRRWRASRSAAGSCRNTSASRRSRHVESAT